MILIAAVDDRNGMLFHHRRQSKDAVLRQKIIELSKGKKLWMNAYSQKQFQQENPPHLSVDEDFLSKAGPGDYCFVEDQPTAPAADRIEKLILFHWNRCYPGDFYLDLDPHGAGWQLETTEEFAGTSHEKITMEIYSR